MIGIKVKAFCSDEINKPINNNNNNNNLQPYSTVNNPPSTPFHSIVVTAAIDFTFSTSTSSTCDSKPTSMSDHYIITIERPIMVLWRSMAIKRPDLCKSFGFEDSSSPDLVKSPMIPPKESHNNQHDNVEVLPIRFPETSKVSSQKESIAEKPLYSIELFREKSKRPLKKSSHPLLDSLSQLPPKDPIRPLLTEIRKALPSQEPELCEEGVNGTYFLKNSGGKIIGIFKPQDEEGDSALNPKCKKTTTDSPYAPLNIRSSAVIDMDDEGEDSRKISMKSRGILPGEAAQREVAAYLLDEAQGHFSGVPTTRMVEIRHPSFVPSPHNDEKNLDRSHHGTFTEDSIFEMEDLSIQDEDEKKMSSHVKSASKIGSVQEFAENHGAAWDIGPQVFPVQEVQKIGILDLQIFNTDRHEGNILFFRKLKETSYESSAKKLATSAPSDNNNNNGSTWTSTSPPLDSQSGTTFGDTYRNRSPSSAGRSYDYTLIPIDHGFSLPDNLSAAWFDWLAWPQAKQPFTASSMAHIEQINMEENASLLEEIGIRPECIRVSRISTLLLKKGAKAGLSLYQIGSLACRLDLSQPSDLERMVARASMDAATNVDVNDISFFKKLEEIMDEEFSALLMKK